MYLSTALITICLWETAYIRPSAAAELDHNTLLTIPQEHELEQCNIARRWSTKLHGVCRQRVSCRIISSLVHPSWLHSHSL